MATGEGGGSSGSGEDSGKEEKVVGRPKFEHSGWVYHLGTRSVKRESCHRRFLHIKGKYVMMYKRDPDEHAGTKPTRRGVVGHTLVLEELGRRRVNDDDLYVLKFSNRLDEEKNGEIACATAGETRKWMEALEQAKKQAEYELSQGSNTRKKLSMENEIDLERHGHRRRLMRYASGVKRLMSTKHGPESLIRRSLSLGVNRRAADFCEGDAADVVEANEWKCIRTVNGTFKILGYDILMLFSLIMCWILGARIFEDVSGFKGSQGVLVKAVGVVELTPDSAFEMILSLDSRQRYEWDTLTSDLELVDSLSGNSDVVYGTYDPRYLTRQWFRGQDGGYTILQFPAVHKKKPPRSGYRRTKVNPSTWEIRILNTSVPANAGRCLITHMLEVHSKGWSKWKSNQSLKFEKTIPYALLHQVSGLKVYIGTRYAPKLESSTTLHKDVSSSVNEYEDDEVADQFYDAISAYSSEDDDSDYEVPDDSKSETDVDCWTSPSGKEFMIRGKTYLQNSAKSDAGKKLPFVFVMNLQVPAKPNYSLVLYFAADTPVVKNSLLGRFIDESDSFRLSRFKLIPSIVEGYWMVKHAVGTKACLLGKALTCSYLRRDNFLEVDVDVGSSSVARSVIGIVLGYVTNIVVDLAILIEAKEQEELPEYILGTVRLNRVRLESAVPLER
ncbi:hypothetical protein Ccrd_024152 [Cynara cardunculus var. scolymus]|uniref:START domain-containing protein n=1 Tax=Cynara cardunculus var. scolymus TaxID=59895 RepID=A0A124SAR6_CYNCS|nr:hypothetical protein Ccrd_024152 [Cynara cardunculus var. scolymus]